MIQNILKSNLLFNFRHSPAAVMSLSLLCLVALCAIFAPLLTAQNPFDSAQLDLLNSRLPPSWLPQGDSAFVLGTDEQGRDLLAALFYGARLSLLVGLASVLFSFCIGVTLGLISGFFGGFTASAIGRLADLQLTFPGPLVALMVAGVVKTSMSAGMQESVMIIVVIVAIGFADWPRFMRVTRSATVVESREDYVLAARVMGIPSRTILRRHILPNVFRPNLVLATVGLGTAILLEATLSFLGAGVPSTTPSLGTLIRVGSTSLFSGEWWVVLFPGLLLIVVVFSINIFGDWLGDALNPRIGGRNA